MKKASFTSFLLLFVQFASFSQDQHLVDSLTNVLMSHNNDTLRVTTLYELSEAYWGIDPDKAMDYAKQSLKTAEQLNYKSGIARAYYSMSIVHSDWGEFSEALPMQEKVLKINKELNDQEGIADAYNEIGLSHYYLGNNPEALKNYLASVRINETLRNIRATAGNYMNIANVYTTTENYEEALKYHSMALKSFQEAGFMRGVGMSYNNIGGVYTKQKDLKNALRNYEESRKIKEELGEKRGLANVYGNIANTYNDINELDEALKNYKASMTIQEEIGDKNGLCNSYLGIGKIYEKEKKFQEALNSSNKALALAVETGNLNALNDCNLTLSRIYANMGNYKKAYEYENAYLTTYDSLFSDENSRKLTQMQMQYEFDKKEAATKAEQDKKNALSKAEISRQKIIRNFSIAGVIVIIAVGGFIFYNFRKRKALESMQTLSNERLRISRELHDDIGSTLGSIAVYSDVAKNRSMKNQNPAEVLSKIGTASRELIEKMSDIVWSLNPDNETFEQLQNRMQAFAAMILTPNDISFEFRNTGEIKSLKLSNEKRKNLFLIYKEAVHNIVKYAECKTVLFTFSRSGNNLNFLIKDDGKGFDMPAFTEGRAEAYNGNGLRNMKSRASDINATLHIISAINEGTSIELKLMENA